MGLYASRKIICALLILFLACSTRDAFSQTFGRNKVEYEDLKFAVLKTTHFDIYHYPDEEPAARIAARLAERWYVRLSTLLDHELQGRQPIILYGSHRDFANTNVVGGILDDTIGGVTESLRRRIVMPFAAGLGETDHVLGHEIVHAFQYDIARRHKTSLRIPLWMVEGMAEYLSQGGIDSHTATWIRDAIDFKLLPAIAELGTRRASPYRMGQALWSFVGGRYGETAVANVLKIRRPNRALDRMGKALGVDVAVLSKDWHAAMAETYSPREQRDAIGPERAITSRTGGRLNIGPALSPDGRHIVFLSERDRLSIDLFLAKVSNGRIVRKLATTAANPDIESLQPVQSAGSWDPEGRRFVYAALSRGTPVLTVVDPFDGRVLEEVRLPQFGEVMTPAFSPDGKALAFAALQGGLSDLFVYNLRTRALEQITKDAFADLQPVWSPDGATLAFASDRFSSDLDTLDFGPLALAEVDLATAAIRPAGGFTGAKHVDPEWSADGRSLFFVSDPDGISDVYRLDRESGAISRLTRARTGVTGLTGTSPVISLAASAPRLVFSTLRAGRFELQVLNGTDALAGEPIDPDEMDLRVVHAGGADSQVREFLRNPEIGLPLANAVDTVSYAPRLSLHAIAQPYFMSGGGRFGTIFRGGASVLFGDMLGEQALGAAVQLGNRRDDVAVQLRYLNRGSRWNWGGLIELAPGIRGRRTTTLSTDEVTGERLRETERFRQFQGRVAGLVSYPFSRALRVEFQAGVRHVAFDRAVQQRTVSASGFKVLSSENLRRTAGAPATSADASVALVHDTAVFGATGPIMGTRWRIEATPTIGDLSYLNVLADYRRYEMPAQPYTIAFRVLHAGRYGRDADDPRLMHYFLGSRQLVRGYNGDEVLQGCRSTLPGDCATLDPLFGSRTVVGKLEFRAPLIGAWTRELRYGSLPAELFGFADAGLSWSRTDAGVLGGSDRGVFRSVGFGVRVNALAGVLELAAARPLDGPFQRWRFVMNLQPGF